MGVRYEKLFKLLEQRSMTTRELQKQANFSGNITTRMKRNEYISMESVEKICHALDCRVDDIIEFDTNKKYKSSYEIEGKCNYV